MDICLKVAFVSILIAALQGVFLCEEENLQAQTNQVKDQLETTFSTYLTNNHFHGGQIGVLVGSKLVYAEGKGKINGIPAKSDTQVPILDLSKAITAVAILQLVEKRLITLNDKVFGVGRLLQDFIDTQPGLAPDSRLYDITIEHLLTHSAGWDEINNDILDPMINPLLLSLGYNISDIKSEMGYFDQYSIIQYVVGKPLDFQPGSKFVDSNLGYSILGRVVEAVTEQPYVDYVHKNILDVSGMWNTHIGPKDSFISDIIKQKYNNHDTEVKRNDVNGIPEFVEPQVLDSTLGWYSNVYDVARFFVCLFELQDNVLLKKSTVKYAMSKFPSIARHHHFRWSRLALNVANDGSSIKQESNDRAHGVNVLFYKEPGFDFSTESSDFSWHEDDNTKTFIFIGFADRYRKHVHVLEKKVLSLDLKKLGDNEFLTDLKDKQINTEGNHIRLINKNIKHNDIVAFSNAMKLAGYYPTWVHGYSEDNETYYITIFKKAKASQDLKFTLSVFKSKAELWTFLAKNGHVTYQMSFIQSFMSASGDKLRQHLLIMTRPIIRKVVMFDLYQKMRFYDRTLKHAKAEGYEPVVQSICKEGRRSRVSYILQKPHPSTRHFNKIALSDIQNKTSDMSRKQYFMTYIDGYTDRKGNSVFSAIYTKQTISHTWKLQMGIESEDLQFEVTKKVSAKYIPKFIISYSKDESLKFLIYWVSHTKLI